MLGQLRPWTLEGGLRLTPCGGLPTLLVEDHTEALKEGGILQDSACPSEPSPLAARWVRTSSSQHSLTGDELGWQERKRTPAAGDLHLLMCPRKTLE